MEYLRLACGLLLPWVGGILWLGALETRYGLTRTGVPLKAGYGLFLGYATLQGLVLAYSRMTGSLDFWPIFAAIALFALAGALFWNKSRPVTQQVAAQEQSQTDTNRLTTALFWLLTAWATLHLLLVAIETLYRPVFPWDGWSSWIYRAKVWFSLGEVVALDSPTAWARASGDSAYAAPGNNYPTFLPVLTLWAATALGRWTETLINLPTLLCGLAMGLGMYGQCRVAGLGRTGSALGAYLLLSIPLIGAHLSLAGHADIWMAGYTGFGFIAIINGCLAHNRGQIILGLAMAAMGIATKMEGAVWLLVAIMTLLLIRHTRITLVVLGVAALLAALGWQLGVTYLDILLLGGLGITDGRVYIPLIGNYHMQTFDLWDDYRDNFFAGGSWHLLWTLVILSVASLWLLPAGTLRRSIIVFYAMVLVAQLFIFEVTESGHWAEDWTAINRLPLHFVPAFVFLLLLQARALLERVQPFAYTQKLLQGPALGLAITLASSIAWLILTQPAGTGDAVIFTARDLGVVVGAGHLEGEVGLIDDYSSNIAVVSSGPISMAAQGVSLLRVETRGENSKPATFFWRNGKSDSDLHSTQVAGRGIRYLDLDRFPKWRGQITELGLLFYEDDGKSTAFHSLQIGPHKLGSQLARTLDEWGEVVYWDQKSVNFIPAGAESSALPLPYMMAGWAVVAILLAALVGRRFPSAYPGALVSMLLAWAVLDVRWTANGLAQAVETMNAYAPIQAQYLDIGDDREVRRLIEESRRMIEMPGKRTLIMAEDSAMEFETLRAKYHALPAAAFVHKGRVQSAPLEWADYLLVLKKRYADISHPPATAESYVKLIKKRTGLSAKPVWESEDGFLLELPARSIRTPDPER